MLSNKPRAVGFDSIQLGLRDASIVRGSKDGVVRLGGMNEKGFKPSVGRGWTAGKVGEG